MILCNQSAMKRISVTFHCLVEVKKISHPAFDGPVHSLTPFVGQDHYILVPRPVNQAVGVPTAENEAHFE